MAADDTKAKKTQEKKDTDTSDMLSYYEAIGRRREATARVRLYVAKEAVSINGTQVDKGGIIVNNRPVDNYFPGEVMKRKYLEPFRTTNTVSRFAVSIRTAGGGLNGQLDAVVLGISRALEKIDKDKYRPILKKRGFLSRDSRIKERRKAGLAHKARAKKQSPKR